MRCPRATALALVIAAAVPAAAVPAAAAPGPIDAPAGFVTAVHPITGLAQQATGVSAGYIGEPDATFPRVGDVFELRAVVAITGTLPDVPILTFVADALLLPDITLAIDARHPVRCFFSASPGAPPAPDDASCNQSPTGSLADGAFFGGRGEMQPGETFEIRVPVRVTRPKAGLATGAAARFGVQLLSSHGRALSAQHLVVAPVASGGAPAGRPSPVTAAPRASRLAAVVGRADRRGRRPVTVRLRLSGPAQVRVTLQRRARPGGPFRALRRPAVTRRLAAGTRRLAIGRLAPGAYRAVIRARGGDGAASTARVGFRVR